MLYSAGEGKHPAGQWEGARIWTCPEPEGNGRDERFVRTLKEQKLWIQVFATGVELVEALRAFRRTYNEWWLIGRHGHRPPSQVWRDLISCLPTAA